MSLTNEQQERFQILLQQLQIPDDLINQYLQGGGIERLVIDKANKSWHFDLQVPRILPTELYELLETKLKQSFSHIARTTFALETENKQFTEEEVRAYLAALYGTNYIFTYVRILKEAASAGEWSEVANKCE